jgi:hypothetical protein
VNGRDVESCACTTSFLFCYSGRGGTSFGRSIMTSRLYLEFHEEQRLIFAAKFNLQSASVAIVEWK